MVPPGMRGLLILIVLAVAGLWGGGHSLYVTLRNGNQVEVSCADYEKSRPDAEWLLLTHCAADVDNIALETNKKSGKLTKVYVPVRPEGSPEVGSPKIVVESDDDDLLELARDLRTDSTEKSAQRLGKLLAQPIDGLVRLGLELDDKRQTELANLNLGLTKDFAIVERGAHPKSIWFGLGVLLLGVGAAGWVVFKVVRRVRA